MARDSFPHIRRFWPGPVAGKWRIDCDCGWRGELPEMGNAREDLEPLFVAHIPPDERAAYLMVDQSPSGTAASQVLSESGEVISETMLARGNWIMPAGIPCTVLRWYEDDGFYRAVVREFQPNAPEIDILVGEVRTQDGRVFGCA